MDRGLHLDLAGGGLALCLGRDRPLLAKSRRLVDAGPDDRPTRHRCARDGDLAARKARRSGASFRPGQPIYERAVPASDGRQWRRLFDEPVRQRLRHRRDGELLFLAQTERIGNKVYRTRDAARVDVFDYIERFYNTIRRHSTIGYLSPVEFERKVG